MVTMTTSEEVYTLTLAGTALTGQYPCGHRGNDGCLPLAHTCQKREEETISGHSIYNTRERKHGAQETGHWKVGEGRWWEVYIITDKNRKGKNKPLRQSTHHLKCVNMQSRFLTPAETPADSQHQLYMMRYCMHYDSQSSKGQLYCVSNSGPMQC